MMYNAFQPFESPLEIRVVRGASVVIHRGVPLLFFYPPILILASIKLWTGYTGPGQRYTCGTPERTGFRRSLEKVRFYWLFGGRCRARTCDLLLVRQAL